MHITLPTDQQVENLYKSLEDLLLEIPLPTSSGRSRFATVDEFMLMGIGEYGDAQFKHYNTRNYIFILKSGELHVPKTKKPFMLGFFDEPS